MISASDLTIEKMVLITPIELIETTMVQSTGREDFEYEVGTFDRRIIQSANDVSLTLDTRGNPWTTRWTISKDASTSGDELMVIWNLNNLDVNTSTGLISGASVAASKWNEYLEGDLVEQEGATGTLRSDEAAEDRIEENRERREAEEKAAEEAEAQAEADSEKAEADRQAELESQVKDWEVVQDTSITIPAALNSELFEITKLRPQYSVKLKSGIGKVSAQDEDFDVVYQIEERTYLRNFYGGVQRLETQYRVSLIDSPNGNSIIIGGATPQFTINSAQSIYDSGIEITRNSLSEVLSEGEWIEEEVVQFSWGEIPTNIQEIFEVDNSDVISNATWSRGNFPDTIRFEDEGRTMVVVDFDMPAFTQQGISAKLSGLVAFTVSQGKRMNVTFRNEDPVTWINLADSTKPEGVSRSGQVFSFPMYGGDRMELNIDNEFDGFRPFLVQTKGREWFVSEEPDDTSYLTFSNIERISYDEYITRYYLYDGKKYSEEKNAVALFQNVNASTPQYILDQITDPEMLATLREPSVNAPMTEPESSFVSPDDVKGQIGSVIPDVDLPDNPLDTSNLKWWIIGGVLVIGGFILLGIFVNAKARTTMSE